MSAHAAVSRLLRQPLVRCGPVLSSGAGVFFCNGFDIDILGQLGPESSMQPAIVVTFVTRRDTHVHLRRVLPVRPRDNGCTLDFSNATSRSARYYIVTKQTNCSSPFIGTRNSFLCTPGCVTGQFDCCRLLKSRHAWAYLYCRRPAPPSVTHMRHNPAKLI